MNQGFRPAMAWLHTWSGLLVGWVLYFVFFTGTLGYYSAEIDRWMQPELPLQHAATATTQVLEQAIAQLAQVAPGAERWNIDLPYRKSVNGLRATWRMPAAADGTRGATGLVPLDGGTGARIDTRQTGGGQLLYQMHYRLHYLPVQQAYWIVGFCSMLMLVSILTGVITHKKIFKDFFAFRPAAGQRSWRDAHTVLGSIALPFHLVITYSGLVLLMFTYSPLVLDEIYRYDDDAQNEFFTDANPRLPEQPRSGVAAALTPLAPVLEHARRTAHGAPLWQVSIRNPGDASARIVIVRERGTPQSGTDQLVYDGVTGQPLAPASLLRSGARQTRDALAGLHKGLFASPALRGLYFLSSLMGTALVASGLILWTAKRRARLREGRRAWGLLAIERLNPAMILGPVLGVAAYFWANRLIPAGLAGRGLWEAHALFMAWGLALGWAALRRPQRAWPELLGAAAALYGLLPVLNALTTERHLGVTGPWAQGGGDAVLAGFDLTTLAVALALAVAARFSGARSQP